VGAVTPLPFDRPFRVGGLSVTLRPSGVHSQPSTAPADHEPLRSQTVRPAALRPGWRDANGAADHREQARRWESRWRAVGESVRATPVAPPGVRDRRPPLAPQASPVPGPSASRTRTAPMAPVAPPTARRYPTVAPRPAPAARPQVVPSVAILRPQAVPVPRAVPPAPEPPVEPLPGTGAVVAEPRGETTVESTVDVLIVEEPTTETVIDESIDVVIVEEPEPEVIVEEPEPEVIVIEAVESHVDLEIDEVVPVEDVIVEGPEPEVIVVEGVESRPGPEIDEEVPVEDVTVEGPTDDVTTAEGPTAETPAESFWTSPAVTDLLARVECDARQEPDAVEAVKATIEVPVETAEPAPAPLPDGPTEFVTVLESVEVAAAPGAEPVVEDSLVAAEPVSAVRESLDDEEDDHASDDTDTYGDDHEPGAPVRRLGAARRASAVDVEPYGDWPPAGHAAIGSLEPPRDFASRIVEGSDVSWHAGPTVRLPERGATPEPAADYEETPPPVAEHAPQERPARGDWPTVADIMAAAPGFSGRSGPSAATAARAEAPAVALTVARPPGQRSLPVWLAWLPAAAAVLGTFAGFGWLGFHWARDAYNVGQVASRLESPSARPKPLPEGVAPGRSSWWATTGSNLLLWGAYLDRTATDPASRAEAREFLARSVEVAPLQPGARLSLARPLAGTPDAAPGAMVRALGQPHDVPALAWTGRQFLASGKKDAALRAFGEALRMASRADSSRSVTPPFLDDPETQRYALPGEELIGEVVRELAVLEGLSYDDWSALVPAGTVAPVAVARVLRQLSHPAAGPALETALADARKGTEGDAAADPRTGPEAETAGAVLALAAGAEALALDGRWSEAEERYRAAIERTPDDVLRRAWWMNVADLDLRLNEEGKRLKALELAKNDDMKDEITRRAVALQKASGLGGRGAPLRTARAPLSDR